MTVPIGEITPVDRISRSLLSALESGANVLEGPLSALRHLVGLVMDDPSSPKLRAGEIVSTGTLTRAMPIAPGERWSTKLSGIQLSGISVTRL